MGNNAQHKHDEKVLYSTISNWLEYHIDMVEKEKLNPPIITQLNDLGESLTEIKLTTYSESIHEGYINNLLNIKNHLEVYIGDHLKKLLQDVNNIIISLPQMKEKPMKKPSKCKSKAKLSSLFTHISTRSENLTNLDLDICMQEIFEFNQHFQNHTESKPLIALSGSIVKSMKQVADSIYVLANQNEGSYASFKQIISSQSMVLECITNILTQAEKPVYTNAVYGEMDEVSSSWLPISLTKHFVPINVPGDDNCGYHAISLLLCGNKHLSRLCRILTANHMIKFENEHIKKLNEMYGQSATSQYLQLFKEAVSEYRSYGWASTEHLLMLSCVFQTPIYIYTQIEPTVLECSDMELEEYFQTGVNAVSGCKSFIGNEKDVANMPLRLHFRSLLQSKFQKTRVNNKEDPYNHILPLIPRRREAIGFAPMQKVIFFNSGSNVLKTVKPSEFNKQIASISDPSFCKTIIPGQLFISAAVIANMQIFSNCLYLLTTTNKQNSYMYSKLIDMISCRKEVLDHMKMHFAQTDLKTYDQKMGVIDIISSALLPKAILQNYQPVDVPADHNCAYNAVSMILAGSPKLSRTLRILVAHDMLQNEPVYTKLLQHDCTEDQSGFEIHLHKSLNEGTVEGWCGPEQFLALANVLNRPIYVYSNIDMEKYKDVSQETLQDSFNSSSLGLGWCLRYNGQVEKVDKSPICLFWRSHDGRTLIKDGKQMPANHIVSLVPKTRSAMTFMPFKVCISFSKTGKAKATKENAYASGQFPSEIIDLTIEESQNIIKEEKTKNTISKIIDLTIEESDNIFKEIATSNDISKNIQDNKEEPTIEELIYNKFHSKGFCKCNRLFNLPNKVRFLQCKLQLLVTLRNNTSGPFKLSTEDYNEIVNKIWQRRQSKNWVINMGRKLRDFLKIHKEFYQYIQTGHGLCKENFSKCYIHCKSNEEGSKIDDSVKKNHRKPKSEFDTKVLEKFETPNTAKSTPQRLTTAKEYILKISYAEFKTIWDYDLNKFINLDDLSSAIENHLSHFHQYVRFQRRSGTDIRKNRKTKKSAFIYFKGECSFETEDKQCESKFYCSIYTIPQKDEFVKISVKEVGKRNHSHDPSKPSVVYPVRGKSRRQFQEKLKYQTPGEVEACAYLTVPYEEIESGVKRYGRNVFSQMKYEGNIKKRLAKDNYMDLELEQVKAIHFIRHIKKTPFQFSLYTEKALMQMADNIKSNSGLIGYFDSTGSIISYKESYEGKRGNVLKKDISRKIYVYSLIYRNYSTQNRSSSFIMPGLLFISSEHHWSAISARLSLFYDDLQNYLPNYEKSIIKRVCVDMSFANIKSCIQIFNNGMSIQIYLRELEKLLSGEETRETTPIKCIISMCKAHLLHSYAKNIEEHVVKKSKFQKNLALHAFARLIHSANIESFYANFKRFVQLFICKFQFDGIKNMEEQVKGKAKLNEETDFETVLKYPFWDTEITIGKATTFKESFGMFEQMEKIIDDIRAQEIVNETKENQKTNLNNNEKIVAAFMKTYGSCLPLWCSMYAIRFDDSFLPITNGTIENFWGQLKANLNHKKIPPADFSRTFKVFQERLIKQYLVGRNDIIHHKQSKKRETEDECEEKNNYDETYEDESRDMYTETNKSTRTKKKFKYGPQFYG